MIRQKELWFNEFYNNSDYDIIHFNYSNVNVNNKLEKCYHAILNFEKTPDLEIIFQKFDKSLKNEIRRSLKESFSFEEISLDNFFDFYQIYSDFCLIKRIKPYNKTFFKHNIDILKITKCNYLGEFIRIHVYIIDKNKSILLLSFENLHSCLKNSFKGFANRGLHWFDISLFFKLNHVYYSFGYINTNKNHKNFLISKFKLEFNPDIIECYRGTLTNGVKGKLFLFLKKLYGKIFI